MSENNLLKKNRIKWNDATFIVGTVCVMLAGMFLFYMQSIRYNGGYLSDTYLYVEMSKEQHGIRLITWIFNFLYNLTGNTVGIAIYMGLVIATVIILNYEVINLYLKQDESACESRVFAEIAAIMMLFTGSMYIPGIHEAFYKGSWCTFAWHSPTQQLMICCALASLYLFVSIYEDYMDHIDPLKWVGLMIFSLISVWAKPSFMLVFIPTVVVVFLIELLSHQEKGTLGKRFARLVLYGMSMVPSGLLILLLNSSIYGEGSENSVEVGLKHLLNSDYNIGIAAICGLLFPIVVFLFNLEKFRDIKYQIALGMLVMGIFEWAIFFEEGTRGEHGNFGWGRQFGCYFFFLTAIVVAIENYRDSEFMKEKDSLKKGYFAVLVILLVLHVGTQLYHFYLMARGHSYYI